MKYTLIVGMPSWILSALLLAPGTAQGTWAERLKGTVPPPPAEYGAPQDSGSTVPVENEYDALVTAVKDLLLQASAYAVDSAGKPDGFSRNPAIRITLPGFLNDATGMLRGVGLSAQSELIEQEMNRAAEAAAAEAGVLFVTEVDRLPVSDPRSIVVGPPDGAVRLLRRRTAEALFEELRPRVDAVLLEKETAKEFGALNQQIGQRLPALGTLEDINLADYVTVRTLEGLFLLMAEEEKRIRENPDSRSTEPLREVFGAPAERKPPPDMGE